MRPRNFSEDKSVWGKRGSEGRDRGGERAEEGEGVIGAEKRREGERERRSG